MCSKRYWIVIHSSTMWMGSGGDHAQATLSPSTIPPHVNHYSKCKASEFCTCWKTTPFYIPLNLLWCIKWVSLKLWHNYVLNHKGWIHYIFEVLHSQVNLSFVSMWCQHMWTSKKIKNISRQFNIIINTVLYLICLLMIMVCDKCMWFLTQMFPCHCFTLIH